MPIRIEVLRISCWWRKMKLEGPRVMREGMLEIMDELIVIEDMI